MTTVSQRRPGGLLGPGVRAATTGDEGRVTVKLLATCPDGRVRICSNARGNGRWESKRKKEKKKLLLGNLHNIPNGLKCWRITSVAVVPRRLKKRAGLAPRGLIDEPD